MAQDLREAPATTEPQRRPGGAFWGALVLLTALGVLGNLAHLSITFSVDFIFGSVFTLLVAVLAGPRAGLMAALAASSYTWILWNHPYAIVIFTAETLWVGLAFRRGSTSILLATTAYWLCLGIPLVVLFYGGVLHQDLAGATLIVLKQTLNGIFNALVADLLLALLPLHRWLAGEREPRPMPFSHLLFHQTVVLLMLPTLVLVRLSNQREEARTFETLATTLRSQARQNDAALGRWVADHVRTARAIADLGVAYPMAPSARLQEQLARFRQTAPDLHNVYLINAQGKSVGFDPPVNERGASTLGVDFSDRAYFRRVHQTRDPVISDVFLGRAGALQPIFTISAPVQGPGVFAGIGGGAVNLEKLKTRLLYHEDLRLGTTILDSGGRVLVSTVPGRKSLEPLPTPPGLRVQPVAPEVFLNLPGNTRNKSSMEAWKTAYLSTRLPITGTDWTLLAEYPTAPLRDYFYHATIRNLAWIGVWYLVALGLGAVMARLISQTPARLVALSKDLPARVEAGEPIVWPKSRFQEISQLIDNFRGVTEALAARIRTIHQEEARNRDQERALIGQSRLAAMGELIGNIAHQWRQPLNALSMLLGDLKDAQRAGELTEGYLETALGTGRDLIQGMSSTISHFMDFARADRAPSLFSLRQRTLETLRFALPALQDKAITLEMEDGPDVWVQGQTNEFSQVLVNLLRNAQDAFEARGTRDARIGIRIFAEGDRAHLRFTDNGGGIAMEPIERIFEPYLSGKPGGTGLGLYMSRKLLEQRMQGSISARNTTDGAEFIITLPLREPAHAPDPS